MSIFDKRFIPEKQEHERHISKRRRQARWRRLANLAGKVGGYALVGLMTALLIYPAGVLSTVAISGGYLLLIGIGIGSAMRWRAS